MKEDWPRIDVLKLGNGYTGVNSIILFNFTYFYICLKFFHNNNKKKTKKKTGGGDGNVLELDWGI